MQFILIMSIVEFIMVNIINIKQDFTAMLYKHYLFVDKQYISKIHSNTHL